MAQPLSPPRCDRPPTGSRSLLSHRRFLTAALLILLVAAGLRFYRLPELPLGLHYDEAANVILAGEIARGVKFPIFISSYTGKEVLFFYLAALWMRIVGVTPLALRLNAAAIGLATVATTVWAVRELFYGHRGGKWVALLSGAFLAVSFWHLVLSRYGFRAISQPLMQALTVAALWRGLRTDRPGWLLLAGLCCGLTAYTYLAARAFPIPLAAALLTLLLTDRGRRRARLGQIALFVATAAITLTPLAHYWLTHPGSFLTRAQQVAAADWGDVWNGLRACLGMFFLRGDPYIRFNIPHRPLFDPLTAALFLPGIARIAYRQSPIAYRQSPIAYRQAPSANLPLSSSPALPLSSSPALPLSSSPPLLAARVFLLVSLPIMLLPSALATGDITPSNLRTVGLLPFIYVFPALGLAQIAYRVSHIAYRISQIANLLISLFPYILISLLTSLAYFHTWAPSAALYYAADGDLVDVAAYLNRADLRAVTPYVAAIHYRHPTLAALARDYGEIRWLTGGRTLVFPADRDALLIFPRSAADDLAWVESALPEGALVAAPSGPDGTPAFHAYRVAAGYPFSPTHPLTANLAHVAHLLGYDVIGAPRSGASAEAAIWWRVTNMPGVGDYGPVVRLTDAWGFVWGETQPFHYPSEQWTPGEVIVDHLSIPVAPGTPPGDYALRFSLYSAGTDALLPVLDEAGRYAGAWIELPLHLARAAAPPAPERLGIRARLDGRVGELTLLGVNLDTTAARPGAPLYLTLFWQAGDTPLPDYEITLTLGERPLYAGAPVHGTYPTSAWSTGEIIADRYNPRLPRDFPPGVHPLRLRVGELEVRLGEVAVQKVERIFDAPPIAHPLSVTLGGQVELLGYALSAETAAPGGTLTLTLYWRALAEMETDYTVFTHLLAPDGSTSGQRDNQPVGGSYPTSLWLPGEVVADVYEIPVRADAAPGEHRLEVGMYIAETGVRLQVDGIRDHYPDDAVLLQMVTVSHK